MFVIKATTGMKVHYVLYSNVTQRSDSNTKSVLQQKKIVRGRQEDFLESCYTISLTPEYLLFCIRFSGEFQIG